MRRRRPAGGAPCLWLGPDECAVGARACLEAGSGCAAGTCGSHLASRREGKAAAGRRAGERACGLPDPAPVPASWSAWRARWRRAPSGRAASPRCCAWRAWRPARPRPGSAARCRMRCARCATRSPHSCSTGAPRSRGRRGARTLCGRVQEDTLACCSSGCCHAHRCSRSGVHCAWSPCS